MSSIALLIWNIVLQAGIQILLFLNSQGEASQGSNRKLGSLFFNLSTKRAG